MDDNKNTSYSGRDSTKETRFRRMGMDNIKFTTMADFINFKKK